MTTLPQAFHLLDRSVFPSPGVLVRTDAALGLRLAAVVIARRDYPTSNVSAMDGFAIGEATDFEATLPISQVIAAGTIPDPLGEGTAARIYTGATIPDGADRVIPQEDADLTSAGVRFRTLSRPGAFIRRRGEVFQNGEIIAEVGTEVTPAVLGLFAAAGIPEVSVHPRPRVVIIITGSEVAPFGSPVEPGQLPDSVGPMLAGLCRCENVEVVGIRYVPDDLRRITAILQQAVNEADLVITSGGVSVGDFDFVPQAVTDLGGEVAFHRVAIKPGGPVLVGRIGSSRIVGLPGNPVSALVGFHLFARGIVQRMAGDLALFGCHRSARLASDPPPPSGKTLILPATVHSLEGADVLEILPLHGSHDIRGVSTANALAMVEPQGAEIKGSLVSYLPI